MSTEQGERKQPNETGGTTNPRRPIGRRAGVWVGGVAAAALATVLAGAMSQGFGWFEVTVNTQGDPVDVRVDAEPRMDDVVLSPGAELSTSELAELADLPAEAQVDWLEDNERGEVSGPRRITLYLTGNRAGTVRITDLTSVETCKPISRGTLVRMTSGRGAGVESEIVNIHVGEGPSDAYVYDEVGNPHDYFPERTITLARDEQMALVVDFSPAFTGSICEVQLDLTVWDGNTKHTERVSGPDGPFVVMSIELEEDEGDYGAVYLGGEVCHQYVPAPANWSSDVNACGEGNRAEW
ncbi:hypothetical protein ACFQ58_10970 [Agromyces sp. NPDC056523]|uniref:hypothetical protein n=1 Tax=Agromyces sp. NPDC056523 TaxID=3345850 RepID=UPI00366DB9D8